MLRLLCLLASSLQHTLYLWSIRRAAARPAGHDLTQICADMPELRQVWLRTAVLSCHLGTSTAS